MEAQNGQLAGYELIYQRVSGEGGGGLGDKVKGPPIPAEQEQTVLEGLEKWSWYHLTMAAYTAEGTGPSSAPALCRTDEDGENQSEPREYPLAASPLIHFVSLFSVTGAAPRHVDVQPINSSALRVTWRPVLPRLRHGQIRGYQVHFSPAESSDSRNLPRIKDLLLDESQVTS